MKTKILLVIALVMFISISSYAQTITSYEYWFDMNYADRVNVNVSEGSTATLSNSINTEALTQGYHTFWFHTRSSDGKWSVPVGSTFVKGNNELVGVEYWYDNDYSTKEYMALTPSQGDDYNLQLPVAGLPIGDHLISMCFVDDEQIRSVPISSNFYYDGSVLGIDYLSNDLGINLFPNPSEKQIQLSGIEDYSQLKIFDIQGRIMLTKSIANSNEIVNIEALPSGIYTIQILNSSVAKTMNFVKN
jgi:hypothetical protein